MAAGRCSYCGSVQGASNARGDWVCYACGKTTLAGISGKARADDLIQCSCTHCGTTFRVGASLQGKMVRCKKCGAGFVVSATPATSPSAGDLPPTVAVPPPSWRAGGGSAGALPAVPPSLAVSPRPVEAAGSYPAGGASPVAVPPPPPLSPIQSRDWRTIITVAVGSGLALVAVVAIFMAFMLMRQPGPVTEAGRTDKQEESNRPIPPQQNPAGEQNKPPAAPVKPPTDSNASMPAGNREPPGGPEHAPTKPANPSDKPQPPQDKPPTTESAEPKPKALKDLFQELAPSVPQILVRVDEERFGSGSGFLVVHNGQWYVVTNNHVIENATGGLAVLFLDTKGKPIVGASTPEVRIVRMSKEADVALVDCNRIREKLQANNIRPLRLAPAEYQPPQGEKVFAIGHPGAGAGGNILPLTLTEGIISGVGREFAELKPMKFLQTTASVNPGNSGGPLFDFDGQVVGINTLVIRLSNKPGVNLEGLNFALEIRHLYDLLNNPGLSFAPEEIEEMLKRRARRPVVKPPPIKPDTRIVLDRNVLIGPFQQQQVTVKLAQGEECVITAVPFTVDAVRIDVIDPRNNRVINGLQTAVNPFLIFKVELNGTYRLWVANPNFVPAEVHLTIVTVRPPPQ